jgi:hypothetical protein
MLRFALARTGLQVSAKCRNERSGGSGAIRAFPVGNTLSEKLLDMATRCTERQASR